PRHTPQWATPDERPEPGSPFIPRARSEEPPASFNGPRPLKRRVRGATLRTTADAATHAARMPARPADADAVREALDEFEEAVARANADTAEQPLAPFTTEPGSGDNVPEPARSRDALPHDAVRSHRPPTDDRNPTHHQNHLPEGAEQ
ncbi:MAG TPA: ATP-binding protein, partial [Streptomyces sp.]